MLCVCVCWIYQDSKEPEPCSFRFPGSGEEDMLTLPTCVPCTGAGGVPLTSGL